jgi:hypothetical protein
MKKILLAASFILLVSASASAQFNLGIKGGLNYNTIKAENQEFDESGVFGYQLGVWARLGKGVYLQPEAYIGTKGSKLRFKTLGTSTVVEEEQKFTTLDVPLLLGAKVGGEKLNLRFMAGPAFQFNLGDNGASFNQATNPDYYQYKDFITNVQAGAGVDIGNLSVDLRYETSLQDINKNEGQKQNLLHLSLGFKIL